MMRLFFTISVSDYLQRTRSYTFLITLCISIAIAYTFVPEPNANYSTIRVADYTGNYNSAWFGYITAIMTSVFLSLIGFYLVNSTIKTDRTARTGHIIAATPISNFAYLFSKVVSNFLVLLTIVGIVFLVSIGLFFLYNDGSPFEMLQFTKPYSLITVPTMFFIAAVAVCFEVLFGKYSIIQNIGFFILFSMMMVYAPKSQQQFGWDVFGSKIVIHQIEETVREKENLTEDINMSIGYIITDTVGSKKFHFNGVDFPVSFVISRLLWSILSVLLIIGIAPFFHRFNTKEPVRKKQHIPSISKQTITKEITVSSLPKTETNYSILPLLKTEIALLVRSGKKWLWIVNGIGMILLAVLPLQMAHQLVLPTLWFLQVHRLSELTVKETSHNAHYFAFTSYQPLRRLLTSQLCAGILLMLFLGLPLLIRMTHDIHAMVSIILGGFFITLLASVLSSITKSKRLFEVLFFMITYGNINSIPFLDYFGGMSHTASYILSMTIGIITFGFLIYTLRKYELNK